MIAIILIILVIIMVIIIVIIIVARLTNKPQEQEGHSDEPLSCNEARVRGDGDAMRVAVFLSFCRMQRRVGEDFSPYAEAEGRRRGVADDADGTWVRGPGCMRQMCRARTSLCDSQEPRGAVGRNMVDQDCHFCLLSLCASVVRRGGFCKHRGFWLRKDASSTACATAAHPSCGMKVSEAASVFSRMEHSTIQGVMSQNTGN